MSVCQVCPGDKKISKAHERSKAHAFYTSDKKCPTCFLEFSDPKRF